MHTATVINWWPQIILRRHIISNFSQITNKNKLSHSLRTSY